MTLLETIKAALATIPGIKTCRIGLEDDITPDDYPIIRIVPSHMTPGKVSSTGDHVTRKGDVLIYFGMPIQPFDDVADGSGRTRLEKLYAALFNVEARIIDALSPNQLGGMKVRYVETITDEDRIETYKLMAVRVDVEG